MGGGTRDYFHPIFTPFSPHLTLFLDWEDALKTGKLGYAPRSGIEAAVPREVKRLKEQASSIT